MIATLKDKPSMFFSYNNGLTATASEVISDEQTENTISIKGLKITSGKWRSDYSRYTLLKI